MKLNIGCGTDYRAGFVNVDGSDTLNKVDKVIDISCEKLTTHFSEGSIEFILANDIIEHHFHWEAQDILRQFYSILADGGSVEIRVPDTEYIIRSWRMPLERKIVLLYGGQDIPQGSNEEMNSSRKQFPQYFCHKYGWTRETLSKSLRDIGFQDVRTERAKTNFIAYAKK